MKNLMKKHSSTGIFAIFALVFITSFGIAQNSNFVTYGIEDGLIMSQIETMTQDQNGNLWIGTIGGLSKYDGVEFTNYTQKDSLAEDWITSSFVDSKGNLWLGHWGGGISLLKNRTKSFKDLQLESYSKYKLITSIEESKNGDIIFSTEGAGLFSYNLETQKAEIIDLNLKSKTIIDIEYDANNMLWLSGPDQITVVDIETKNVLKTIPVVNAKSIERAYKNEMWIASSSGILRFVTNSNKNYTSNGSKLTVADGLPSNAVRSIYQDQMGLIWIGTENKGFLQFIPDNTESSSGLVNGKFSLITNNEEMKYYNANTFLQDREGNVWIGTEIGLNKYLGDLFTIFNQSDQLADNLVWAMLADKSGNIWAGTSYGLSRLSFPSVVNGEVKYSNSKVKTFTSANGLSENIIISLFEDQKGNIWAGTEHNGVCVLSKDGKVLKKLNESSGLSHNKVFTICDDKNGNIWLGTKNGATKINPSSYQTETFTSKEGLGGDKVYDLFKDSKGNLWMGILGGKLTKYNGNSFELYGKEQGLNQRFILSISEDQSGNIWLGSHGDGIVKFDGQSFKNYTINDGLSSNTPHFVICDKKNNVWIGQSLGIEKFDQKENKFSLYGKQQGFNGLETNENAVCIDQNSNIWFGTIKGAIKFNPAKDKRNLIEPLTSIESFKIYLKDAEFPEEAEFSYDENYLTFNVLGLSLTNPGEVRYQYFLEGFDKEWSPITSTRTITYSNIPPGDYTLQVKASNNSNIWNTSPASYKFTITPPFWKTWWFYCLCALALIFVVYTYIKQREKKLKERQAFLEAEVDKRTEELRKEKELVETKNVEISNKNKNITESISYAKRIQEAILAPVSEVKKSLPDSFILYQPKDIVSGDFYWNYQSGDKVLFAAVDCTGHGVPGAFMSIVGHNLLNKIVVEKGITKPSAILDELSKEVSTTLRQEDGESNVKDGMDIALCCIDKSNMKVEFSGAYNPLYLVRDKDLQEIKSDKVPIGKGNAGVTGSFTNKEMELKKGDVLYIFSDGYADQKGGAKKKKFFYPPFRKLLLDLHELPMTEQQKKLEDCIEDWRGNIEQYDDMLIFGVRV